MTPSFPLFPTAPREEIVTRFPDLAVHVLLPGLLAAVGGGAKAAFLRAECCR